MLDVQDVSMEEVGLDFSKEIAERIYADEGYSNKYDYLQIYGFKIVTTIGICDIIFRNSSNGYYGGWCFLSKSKIKDGILITDDWSADQ